MNTLCGVERDQSIADGLIDANRAVARHTARFLIRLREFDLHRAYRQPRKGGATSRSTAEWLHETCGVAQDAVRQHLRIAYTLLNLPAIEEAFENGDLSYRKVCAASYLATASNEAAMLASLREMTDQQAEEHCAQARRRLEAATTQATRP